MGTSYKVLLRAFVITSSAFHLKLCSCGKLATAPVILCGFLWCVPQLFCCYFFIRGLCSDSLRFLLSLFICYGLIGKGIHTCRHTFEFLTSGHLRHSGQLITFSLLKEYQLTSFPRDFLALFAPH